MKHAPDSLVMPRRKFLQALAGGSLLLASGDLLSGCGGSDSSVSPNDFDMFVSTFFGMTVERYNLGTGAHLSTFATGIARSNGLAFGPDGDLFVVATIGDSIERYDSTTGAHKQTLKGMRTPHDLRLGPDGNLYVSNAPSYLDHIKGTDTIERFDGRSGASLGTFAHTTTPFGMAFGPDGNLYVSSVFEFGNTMPATDSVLRYDGKTGAPLGTFIQGLKHPYDLLFDLDGNLLVPEYFLGHILKYDKSGKQIGLFATVDFPIGMAMGPDGNVYVGSYSDAMGSPNSGTVHRFNGVSGERLPDVVTGLPFASYITFKKVGRRPA